MALRNKAVFSHNGACTTGDLGPQISALLRDGTDDGRASHLTLGVDDDACVIYIALIVMTLTLEVELVAFAASVALALSDDDSRQHLFTEFWLTLLDRSEEQLADGTLGQSVQTGANHGDGNDVQVLGSSVVSAVHNA